MTFFIDISTHQAGLDIVAARRRGAEAVIVKSVASYLPHLTVADDYQSGIDRTIFAGLDHAKGHYAVPNSENDPEATAEFQMKIVHRRADTDVFMLDNEPLNTYKTFWRDDLAARYFYRLNDLGIRYSNMWLYCPADLTRRSGPWPKTEELRRQGLKIVWVSYGPNYPGPNSMTPDHDVLLGGGITAPVPIRQFTSNWQIPEYTGRIDGNYSPLSIGELFPSGTNQGGGTVSLEAKAREFAAKYPTPASHPSGGDGSWDQDCGRVMFRFGSFLGWAKVPGGDVSSAYRAYKGSKIESLNPVGAPVGAYHWWDIGGEANGHVMQQVDGNTLVFGGTSAVWEDLGVDIGFMSVAEYNRQRPAARYLGWSRDYSGGRVNLASTAGLGTTPITEEEETGDDTMKYINVIGGGRGTVGEITFTPYTAETHGAWADTYAAIASAHYDGEDVDETTYNVLRQDALNRQAQLVSVIAAASGNVDAVIAELKAGLKDAVEEALEGFSVDADISDEEAADIGQIAADRVIARIVAGLGGVKPAA